MYQRGSHLTDFLAVWYWGLQKPVEKFHILLNISGTLYRYLWDRKTKSSVRARIFRRISGNCEKRVLAVRVYPRIAPDWFSWNFILGDLHKICWEIPNLVKIGQKCRALYVKTCVFLIVSSDVWSATIHRTRCYASMATLSILLHCGQRHTYVEWKQRERIFTFPWPVAVFLLPGVE